MRWEICEVGDVQLLAARLLMSHVPSLRGVLLHSDTPVQSPGFMKAQELLSVDKQPGTVATLGEVECFSWLGSELFLSTLVF